MEIFTLHSVEFSMKVFHFIREIFHGFFTLDSVKFSMGIFTLDSVEFSIFHNLRQEAYQITLSLFHSEKSVLGVSNQMRQKLVCSLLNHIDKF